MWRWEQAVVQCLGLGVKVVVCLRKWRKHTNLSLTEAVASYMFKTCLRARPPIWWKAGQTVMWFGETRDGRRCRCQSQNHRKVSKVRWDGRSLEHVTLPT